EKTRSSASATSRSSCATTGVAYSAEGDDDGDRGHTGAAPDGDRRQPRHPPPRPSRRLRLPGHRRGARPGGGVAAGRADGRPADATRRPRAAGRAPGRPGGLPARLRRPGVPPDARDLRRSRGPDRHARPPRRGARRDRLPAPARLGAAVDRRGGRGRRRHGGAGRGAPVIHNRWHPDLEPVAEVAPGEEIRLETEEGLGGQLTPESTHADAGSLNLGLGHPLTGPVYVQGAEAGDALEIEFVSYESADFGTTAVIPGFGFLADLFPDPYLVKWEIDAGVARSAELPGVAVPEALFAGVAGVAPSRERLEAWRRREEALHAAGQLVADPMPETAVPAQAADGLRTIPPRELGGNLDVR